jgi:uroporphyrin-III C-methyltransferase
MPVSFSSNQIKGKVVFIGAGPGDADLITLKAVKHLNKADIVLVDRLVNPEIVSAHAAQAIIIPVGKQCRKQKSTPQKVTNELLVHHALKGRYVVRLKGGDISIFSNILDELEILLENQIPYELVPGITAALGSAASAGVPLTARGFSTGVRLLTYYNQTAIEQKEWENMAETSDTLVFYMSGVTCFELVKRLLHSGKEKNTPILLVEQATTPAETFYLSTLQKCLSDWSEHDFASPALLIIGKVASLYHRFAWHYTLHGGGNFFKDLTISAIEAHKSSQNITPKRDSI